MYGTPSVSWTRRSESSPERGFTLIETLIALGILSVGLLSMATVFARGVGQLLGSSSLSIAKDKAAEAIESVFTSRDTRIIAWAQVRNQADGGIFLDGPQPVRTPGADGLVNTSDDGEVEQIVLPGPDGVVGTADDEVQRLDEFTREVRIIELSPNLREIRVIVTYPSGSSTGYVLSTYMSSFA